jgi:hypothetical protein
LTIHDVVNISRLKPYFGKLEKEEVDVEYPDEESEDQQETGEQHLEWNLMFDDNGIEGPQDAGDDNGIEGPQDAEDAEGNEEDELPEWIEPRKASVVEMRRIMDARGMNVSSRATRDDVRIAYENAYRDKQQQVDHIGLGREQCRMVTSLL